MLSDAPYWRERQFRAMGTTAHLIVGDAHEELLDWAVDRVERLEQSWSRFRPDSELSRLVERAGTWVQVSPDLLVALTKAGHLWKRTAGAFDPTVLTALETLGYDRTFAAVDRDGAGSAPRSVPAPGFDAVELDDSASAVRVPPGVRIDLGGVGKGLAADLLADDLILRGAASVLVGFGGDIRTAGAVPDGGWHVPVQDPFDPSRVWEDVVLGTEAIVTSTSLMRRWRRGGKELHHIVDPISGSSTDSGVVAVVARGAEAWWAEGLAKSAMVLGESAAPELFDGTGVEATMFRADGTAITVNAAEVLCSPS